MYRCLFDMLSLIGLQALLHVFPPHPSRNPHRGRRYRTHRVPVQIVGAHVHVGMKYHT